MKELVVPGFESRELAEEARSLDPAVVPAVRQRGAVEPEYSLRAVLRRAVETSATGMDGNPDKVG